jgi:hypothetical protein
MVEIGAIDSLSNAVLEENLLGINPIRLLSGTSIGIPIADVCDPIVKGTFFEQDCPFTGSAKAAVRVIARVLEADSPAPSEGDSVCENGYRGKVVVLQDAVDIDVEAIADNFQIDVPAKTKFMESPEVRIDEGSLHDEVFHLLGGYLANPGYLFIGLPRADFPLPIQSIDLLPVPAGKRAQELVAHIPHAYGPIEITEDEVFHGIFLTAFRLFG